MRRVQLDGLDAGADRAFGGIDEAVAHALHVRRRHLARHRPIGAECNGGRSDRLPSVLSRCKRLAALPRPSRGGLASGMGELDAELRGAIAAAVGDDARKRGFAIVRIEPEAAVGDATASLGAGGLDHDQRRPGIGEHTEVRDVPTGGHAVVGAVLAHRRDHDAVREFEIGELDGRKQRTGHVTRMDLEAGTQVNHREWRRGPEAPGTRIIVRLARDATAQSRAGGNSSRGAAGRMGRLSFLGRDIIRRRRRDLGPSLAQSDGFAHTIKELLLAVITLPPPAVIELEKMCAPTFGEETPFLGDLVECMPGEPCRHGCRNARCNV